MRSTTANLRPAKPTDRDRLVEINEAAWKAAYRGILDEDFLARLEVSPQRWSDRIASGQVLVSSQRRRVVGYATWGAAEDEGWGEVQAVYVDPDHQRVGHGTRLLEAATVSLSDAGFGFALLWVIDANWPAREFYEKCGWKLAKPFRIEEIGGVQVTLVRYELDLRRFNGR
jgi:ribosomal protein S18 acetylase RimI-like enzyme